MFKESFLPLTLINTHPHRSCEDVSIGEFINGFVVGKGFDPERPVAPVRPNDDGIVDEDEVEWVDGRRDEKHSSVSTPHVNRLDRVTFCITPV